MRNPKLWMLALASSLAVGLAVAAVMTYLDWRINPSGIYHGQDGTHWDIVLETALTWFWPISLAALPFTVAASLWLAPQPMSAGKNGADE